MGVDPNSIAVGDLDGDGDMDLVTSNGGSHDVSILLQQVAGFAPELRYPSGSRPAGVALGHLNDDTHLDLVVAHTGSHDFAVHLGLGDGSFAGPAFHSIGPGAQVDSLVALLDFDVDGELDVLIKLEDPSPPDDPRVNRLFPGNGDGSFTGEIEFDPAGSVFADFDGDGRPDMFGNVWGAATLWLGTGDGTLQPPFEIAVAPWAVGDFNGDSRTDLAKGHYVSQSLLEIHVVPNECLGADMRLKASEQSLEWRGMCGAQSYNVYRQDFTSAMSDRNEDGLPDDGYGQCVNDLDDDTTDTLLAAPEIPLRGGNGFAYLVSWVDLEGERGMGTTSAGLPRDDVLPCP